MNLTNDRLELPILVGAPRDRIIELNQTTKELWQVLEDKLLPMKRPENDYIFAMLTSEIYRVMGNEEASSNIKESAMKIQQTLMKAYTKSEAVRL